MNEKNKLQLQKEIDKDRARRSLSIHRGDTEYNLGELSDMDLIGMVFPVAKPVIDRS